MILALSILIIWLALNAWVSISLLTRPHDDPTSGNVILFPRGRA